MPFTACIERYTCSLQACSFSLSGWGLIDLPLRATFAPAHPLARRDAPLAQARAFQFFMPFLEGAAKAVLYCTHRTSIILLIDPSKLTCVFSPGRAPMLVYVRPSNEALLRARVPGAQDQRGCHSIPFIVRVLRARRTPGRSLPIPSETARCASTEDHQASSPLRSASKKGTWLLPARLAGFFSILLELILDIEELARVMFLPPFDRQQFGLSLHARLQPPDAGAPRMR